MMIKVQDESHAICHLLKRIRLGEDDLKNDLIAMYIPFIAKSVSEVCKRSINKNDDELGVGMEAFSKAVDEFDDGRCTSFFAFAKTVIQRKVIDYLRKEKRSVGNLVYGEFPGDTELWDYKEAVKTFEAKVENEEFSNDVLSLEVELKKYKISFLDLTEESPSHKDARDRMKGIAKSLVQNEEISKYIKNKRRLPISRIMKVVDVNKKTIERNRKYLIGLFLIYSGEYYSISKYLE